MITADTSTWISFFKGDKGKAVEALKQKILWMCPVVLTEILSDPKLDKKVENSLKNLPLLDINLDFWIRVGHIRSKLLSKRLKIRLGDALIAQFSIDHKISLITRDKDFRHFEKHVGLKVIR